MKGNHFGDGVNQTKIWQAASNSRNWTIGLDYCCSCTYLYPRVYRIRPLPPGCESGWVWVPVVVLWIGEDTDTTSTGTGEGENFICKTCRLHQKGNRPSKLAPKKLVYGYTVLPAIIKKHDFHEIGRSMFSMSDFYQSLQ